MTDRADLLVELGTEELPPATLSRLAQELFDGLAQGLQQADLSWQQSDARCYATPRRLAVLVPQLSTRQADRQQQRLGPGVDKAWDEQGRATAAAAGFARSLGVDVQALQTLDTDKGKRLAYTTKIRGQDSIDLLAGLITSAVDRLSISKPMRWGTHEHNFVRPLHWVVALLGNEVIPGRLFEQPFGRLTRGHRFLHPDPIELAQADAYEKALEGGKVIADPKRRQASIAEQVQQAAQRVGGQALIDPALLREVTHLVEWPRAIVGAFDRQFLQLPAEVLIATMQYHQKFFPVADEHGQLQAHFVAVANIECANEGRIAQGYERVIRPRLADARFFWQQDLQTPLAQHHDGLTQVIYQTKLGSLADKSARVEALAQALGTAVDADLKQLKRAAYLAKCDLLTAMVNEFPELQGTVGRYYALEQGEDQAVAVAIEEHYRPRFAGDQLPGSALGLLLGAADRLDTLAAIFAAGQSPRGNRDPFALRRNALGLLRILIEGELDFDLSSWLQRALTAITPTITTAPQVHEELLQFVMERLRVYYSDQGISHDVFDAVWSLRPTQPLDFHRRVQACQAFRQLDAAKALAAANKRIGNILRKAEEGQKTTAAVDPGRFSQAEEQALWQALEQAAQTTQPLIQQKSYRQALIELAALSPTIDQFFDQVMVMVEDPELRHNRLLLLQQVKRQFDEIADISKLVID